VALLLAVVGAASGVVGQDGSPTATREGEVGAAAAGRAPAWTLLVHGVTDPYFGGPLQESPPGARYVGVEVEVVNDGDQPLSYTRESVRLRDDRAFEYRNGAVSGAEPVLPSRALPPGERARGWAWFVVPDDAVLEQVFLLASAPELRVGLAGVAATPRTPEPTATHEPTATAPATPPRATPAPATPPAATPAPAAAATAVGATPTRATPAPATPPPSPTEEPADEADEAGAGGAAAPTPEDAVAEAAFEVVAEAVNLRAEPSLTAPVVGTLARGDALTVTGPAVPAGGIAWLPVAVPGTGVSGYVAEVLIAPAE
jgi:hypothetical protein